ncbi:MAG: hypothetical protein ACI4ST_05320 [Candidatus Gallimonas sp.]
MKIPCSADKARFPAGKTLAIQTFKWYNWKSINLNGALCRFWARRLSGDTVAAEKRRLGAESGNKTAAWFHAARLTV